MVICYIGIGSNSGDKKKNIRSVVNKIDDLKNTKVIKLSKIIETEPIGGPPQGKFLNAALKIKTGLSCFGLLKELKQIEKALGRKRTVRYGPRAIDLDILFFGDRLISSKCLEVPHPKIFEREFVIRPLLDII